MRHPSGVVGGLRPLTQRILDRLPGPDVLWIALWALVPWLNAAANLLLGTEGTSAVWDQSDVLVVLNYAALSVAMVITLWGTARIARRVDDLGAPASSPEANAPFRGMNSVRGPLVASTMTAVAFAAFALERDGWASAVVRGATWFVLGIAMWTFLWAYASLQLGLDRLGRQHLPDGPPSIPASGSARSATSRSWGSGCS